MSQLLIVILILAGTIFAYSSGNDEIVSNLKPTDYQEVNQLDDVNMVAIDETISPTGLTLLFENETGTEFTYGEAYILEERIDEEWFEVPIQSGLDYAFVDIGHTLSGNASAESAVDWEWLFGAIDPGEYRIIKEVMDVRAPGDYDTYPLSAEFIIE